MKTVKRNSRSIALFFLGCILFNFPILSLFNREGMFSGFPLLVSYLFFVWILFVLLIRLLTDSGNDSGLHGPDRSRK